MLRRYHLIATLALTLVFLPAARGGDARPAESTPARSVADIALAHKLIEHGRRAAHAEAMLLAADLLLSNPAQDEKLKATSRKDPKGPMELVRKPGTGPSNHPKDLIAEALKMSDDVAIADWAKRLRKRLTEKPRSEGNPLRGNYKVDAAATLTLERKFEPGKVARVMVQGDGFSEINLHIIDESGAEVRGDTNPGSFGYAEFVPAAGQTYRIELRNLGPYWTQVTVVSN